MHAILLPNISKKADLHKHKKNGEEFLAVFLSYRITFIIRMDIELFKIGIELCAVPFYKALKLLFMVAKLLGTVLALNKLIRFIGEALRMFYNTYLPHDKQRKSKRK